jgi:hypothetical protein
MTKSTTCIERLRGHSTTPCHEAAIKYQSLSELLDLSAAAAELRQHAGYSWIYVQILTSPGWFSGFLRRHGLRVPEQPPVPRRYFGEPWCPSSH